MYSPITIKNVFDSEDVAKLQNLVSSGTGRRVWYDNYSKRHLIHNDELESYFSKKLEPLAREIFKDPTLKTSFSLYAKYDHKSSWLSEHVDRHACVYTLDYCLSAKTVWPLVVDGVEYPIAPNEALAFMGMDSPHGRKSMPDAESNIVEMVFFHFVPEDHWFFQHCNDFIPDGA